MRRVMLFLIALSLPSAAHAWAPTKVDERPTFSLDGRYLIFERWHGEEWYGDVVVMDLVTGKSRPVVGRLYALVPKDRHTFVATGEVYACVVGKSGAILSAVWSEGAGSPHITAIENQFGKPQWLHGRLTFETRDIGWQLNRRWEFNPLTDRVSLVSSIKNTSKHDLNYPRLPWPRNAPKRLDIAVAPAISPDSRTLAVCAVDWNGLDVDVWSKLRECGYWQNVYLLNRDGSGLRRLTSGGGTHPVWHPNGKGLAYITPKGDLAWINRDGTGFTRLVKGIKVTSGLRWDPDGKSFRVQQQTEDGIAWYRIVPPSNTLRLIGKPTPVPPNTHAFLSPSGMSLIWFKRGQQTTSVTLITGQTRRQFAFGPERGGEWYPSAAWSPDEKKLAFTVMGSLRVMDLPSGKIKQLTGPLY